MPELTLVTGANGFVGSSLVKSIRASGSDVIGLDIRPAIASLASLVSDWITCDLSCDCSALSMNFTSIFHCAGAGTVGPSFEDPARDFQSNVASTVALMSRLRKCSPGARIVLLSSAAVYGNQPSEIISELAVPRPQSPYGVHKLAAEQISRDYARLFDLRTAIVRLFSVYGVGLRKQLLWDGSNKIMAGDSSFAGTGGEMRDWLHVDDAVELLRTAADVADGSCPVVNGGTGVGIPTREVLECLSRSLGKTGKISFSGKARVGDPASLTADIRIARSLGWSPKVSWRNGISNYARWFLEESCLGTRDVKP